MPSRASLWAALALFAPASALAAESCQTVAGLAKLTPDLACQLTGAYPGPIYLGQPGTCFTLATTGSLKGTGFSGLTLETTVSLVDGRMSMTPLFLNESGLASAPNELGLPETRRLFTARTALTLAGGRIFSADAGAFAKDSAVEQLLITGGEGKYAGARGYVNVVGNVINNWAPYLGRVCTPAQATAPTTDDDEDD